MKIQHLDAEEVRSVLYGLPAQTISINFIKRDGTKRRIKGQVVRGPDTHKNHENLITVMLADSKPSDRQFRSVDVERVTRIAGRGNIFMVRHSLDKSL